MLSNDRVRAIALACTSAGYMSTSKPALKHIVVRSRQRPPQSKPRPNTFLPRRPGASIRSGTRFSIDSRPTAGRRCRAQLCYLHLRTLTGRHQQHPFLLGPINDPARCTFACSRRLMLRSCCNKTLPGGRNRRRQISHRGKQHCDPDAPDCFAQWPAPRQGLP